VRKTMRYARSSDMKIAFDQDENAYRISNGYEFAAIGEWVSD